MKRTTWLAVACLLGGLMVVALASGLRGPARAAEVAATSASALDVVINEVAWGGTAAGSADEWIELYNNTDLAIDLNGWTLQADDGTPSITLTGSIPAHGYYLLERTDDTTVNDVPADQIYTGGLENNPSAETLRLRDNDSTEIDTANQNGGIWPGGTAGPSYFTMERIDSATSDTDSNWASNDSVTRNGLDAGNNPINGTPKCRNSASSPAADLTVGFSGVPTQTNAGDRFTYTLHFRNAGNITATTPWLTNTLPTELTFFTQTSSYTFTQPTTPTLVWQVGDLPISTTLSAITVTVDVDNNASGILTSVITATTAVTDAPAANNTARITVTVQETPPTAADLSIAKSGPTSVDAGDLITYHIALSNTGTTTATSALLTDTLPTAVDFVAQTSDFGFSQPGGALVWQVGDVLTGALHLITVTGRVTGTATGALTNLVTATTTASETVTTNNTDDWTTTIGMSGTADVWITALHYYGYDGYNDEAMRLMNLGAATADLSEWYLADDPTDTSGIAFPSGATLVPGASIWCAKSAAAFADEFGFKPDYETDETEPTVPEMIGTWPGFTNDGDECALFDSSPQLMDVLVYGDSTSQIGWSGTAVQPWTPSNAFARAGQILYRKLDQATGRPVPDTNTAADWAQDPNDHINGRKVQYPGWDLDDFFQTTKVTETASLVVAVAPDNAYEVIKSHLDSASTSILIEGYTFENAHLIDAVVSRAQAGVTVRILLEGEKVTDQQRWFCQRLHASGGEAYFLQNDDAADIHDRYRFQHAKFIILDSQTLIVGSENFNYSGLPADDKSNGTWGRRGAFLITDAPGVVAQAQAVFDRDLDTDHKDIVLWASGHPRYGDPTPGFTPTYIYSDWVTHTVRFSQPLSLTNTTFAFEMVQSPENSLRDTDGLLGLVNQAGAGDTVLVEQLYEREHWGATASTPITAPNPRLEAYITAARNGAIVRILLNGSPDAGSVDENRVTCDYVNTIAQSEGLDLEAQLGDPAGRGIHNKMVLVWLHDEGGYAHVGSINGSETSSKANREMALQVRSDDVYHYLARVFEVDWWLAHPVFLPLVLRNYTPPAPPVDYVVISEVYYAGSASTEWVELYNPTGQVIDLSSYKIGDAETADRFEGMYQFPSGTTIPSQGVLVVAFDGSQVPQADFEMSNNSATPDMIKCAAWGTGDWTLRNDGDQALLLGPAGQIVDMVVWGDATYPGVNPHPGVSVFTHSLERYPPYYDTDDCALDFRDQYPATPGALPE